MKISIAKSTKVLIQNLSYLSILNIVTLVAPLITLPYLLKILSVEVYGAVAFAQAIGYYMEILVRFGYNITGVKYVSENRNDLNKLSEGISSILIVKTALFLLGLLIIIVINTFFSILSEYPYLLVLSMWITLYQALSLSWYFQGIEKMQFTTIADSLLRVIFILLIFSFIKSSDDYLLVPIFYGIGALLSSLMMFYIVFWKHKVKIIIPSKSTLIEMIIYSYPIFLSQISQIYSKLNKVFVGLFLGYNEVAIYDLVEKVINVFKMPINIIGVTIFPRISFSKSISFIKKTFAISMGINMILILILLFFSDYLLLIITKDASIIKEVSSILRVFSFVLLIVTANVFLGRNTLYTLGYKDKYVKSIMLASLIYGIAIVVLYTFNIFSLITIVLTIMLAEITTMLISLYYVIKFKLLVKKKLNT